jgi:DNA-binding winged helix-turn-helix (wHTH) protein
LRRLALPAPEHFLIFGLSDDSSWRLVRVTFEFGPFQLDEPGRVLRLAEREMSLQPRVFDLLVYLVRSRTRVVSKDELLDALWPGVTVTEGSLQRAVSTLRAVLREGGMEETIRSWWRRGSGWN